jgi:hypothetical protein
VRNQSLFLTLERSVYDKIFKFFKEIKFIQFSQKSNDETIRKLSVEAVGPKKKKSTTNNPLGSFSKATAMDQRDRSLTVMIPRAKYHPQQTKQGNLIDVEAYKSKSSSTASVNQSKLINYLDASPSTSKSKNVRLRCDFETHLNAS